MKSKSILLLLVGAAGLAGAAWFVNSKRGEAPAVAAGKLFPELAAKINDAARVEIVKGGTQTVLAKTGEGAWVVESRGGYPAEFENIKSLVVNLSKSEIVEEKTANPESYARIGVEDPKPAAEKPADGATPEALGSTQLTIKDAGGKALASVILGNAPAASGMSTEQARFARRAGEKPSYLIKPSPSVEPGVMTWINREVMKLDGTRIQSVMITTAKPLDATPAPTPDGQTPSTLDAPPLPQEVLVERGAPTAQDAMGKFEFKNTPPGRELKSPGQDGQIGSALAYVDMEDVLPAAQVSDAPVVATAEYRTKDGLLVVLTTRDKDGKTWGTIEASAFAVLPAPKAEEKPADATKEGEAKDAAKVSGAQAGPAVPVIDPKIEEEAKKLNGKLKSWAFAIPSWKAGQFKSNWKELVKEPTPAAAAPGPEGPMMPSVPSEKAPG